MILKLISRIDQTLKHVNYFGISLSVPSSTTHIATDSDGCVCTYSAKPLENIGGAFFYPSDDDLGGDTVAIVDLDGADWRDTLVEV